MTRQTKTAIIIAILAVLSTPVGILLPELFHAGDAWGEWDTKTLAKKLGYTPEGLKKLRSTYKAPIPDYSFDENIPPMKEALSYIASGLIGIIGISVIFGIALFVAKRRARQDANRE